MSVQVRVCHQMSYRKKKQNQKPVVFRFHNDSKSWNHKSMCNAELYEVTTATAPSAKMRCDGNMLLPKGCVLCGSKVNTGSGAERNFLV